MNKTETNEESGFDIKRHRDNSLKAFRKGQKLHRNYVDAPEKHQLTDEVEQFSAQLQTGIEELNEVIKLQNEHLDKTG